MKSSSLQTGFTLVESLVAIAILVIATLGPLSLLSKAIVDSRYAENQIIASYLAQEGVELALYKRDAIKYNSRPDGWEDVYETGNLWLTTPNPSDPNGLGPCTATGSNPDQTCDIDALTAEARGSTPIVINGKDFTRVIQITPVATTDPMGVLLHTQNPSGGVDQLYRDAQVVVTVNWQDRAVRREVRVSTIITQSSL